MKYVRGILAIMIFSTSVFAAEEAPQTFTLDGRLYSDATGTTPLNDTNVTLVFQILNDDESCILYEETRTGFNSSVSNGYFNLQIGSEVGAIKRSGGDSGNSMASVYSNTMTIVPGKKVSDGTACSATPQAGDQRYVRIQVTPSSGGTRTLTPNMALDSVPHAIIAERAESLRGLAPSQLLQVNTTAGQALSQTNVENIFTTSNYNLLLALLNGTSTLYTKPASNGTIAIPNLTSTPPATPAAGQIWYDAGVIKYYDGVSSSIKTISTGTSTQVSAAAGSAATPSISFAGDPDTGWYAPLANTLAAATGGTERVRIDNSGNVGVGAVDPTFGTAYGANETVVGVTGKNDSTNSIGRFVLANNRPTATNLDYTGFIDFVSVNNPGSERRSAGIGSMLSGAGGINGYGGDLRFYTKQDNSTYSQKMIITPNGNVGIGTTAPNADLHVENANPVVRVKNNSTAAFSGSRVYMENSEVDATGGTFYFMNEKLAAGAATGSSNFQLRVTNAGGDRTDLIRINSTDRSIQFNPTKTASATFGNILIVNGNVGIGTTAPGRLLHVNGPMRVQPAALPGTPATGDIAVDSGDSNKLKYYNGSAWLDLGAGSGGSFTNVSNISNTAGDITLAPQVTTGKVAVTSGTSSTSSTTGALVVTGGLGVSENVNVAGNVIGNNLQANTKITSPQIYGSTAASGTLKLDGTSNATKGDVLINSAGGNVGIGTTSPSSLLDLQQSQTGVTQINVANTNTAVSAGAGINLSNGSKTGSMYISSSGAGAQYANRTSLDTDGNGFNFFATGASADIRFYTTGYSASKERMRIDSTGNVGIGTTAPTGLLNLNTTGATTNSFVQSSVTGTNELKQVTNGGVNAIQQFKSRAGYTPVVGGDQLGGWQYYGADATATPVMRQAGEIMVYADGTVTAGAVPGMMTFNTASSAGTLLERMRINSSGNVGIGTSVPASALHVSIPSGGPVATFTNNGVGAFVPGFNTYAPNLAAGQAVYNNTGVAASTNNAAGFNFHFAGSGSTNNRADINFYGGSPRLSVRADGNVGIGTTNPAATLHLYNTSPTGVLTQTIEQGAADGTSRLLLKGGTAAGSISVAGPSSSSPNTMTVGTATVSSPLVLQTAGNERVRVDAAGNVGIGTTAPARALHVAGPMRIDATALPGTPATGDIAVDLGDSNKLKYYNGSAWLELGAGSGGSFTNVSNISNSTGDVTIAPQTTTGKVAITSGTPSSSTTSGALVVTGGAGVSGNVNVGGSVNSNTLNVTTSGVIPQLYGSTAASGDIKIDGTSNATKGNVLLATGGGNVGVGTTAPTAALDISSGSWANGQIVIGGTPANGGRISFRRGSDAVVAGTLGFDSASGGAIVLQNSGGGGEVRLNATNATGFISNYTNNTERMRIDSAGNVGIGTTAPNASLDLTNASFTGRGASIELSRTDTEGSAIYHYLNSGTTGNLLVFGMTGCEFGGGCTYGDPSAFANAKMVLTAGGRLGVGITNPISQFANSNTNITDSASDSTNVGSITWATGAAGYPAAISNTGSAATNHGLLVKTTSSATGTKILNLESAGSSRFLVRGDGNVGIGTSAPARALHVAGPIRIDATALPGTPVIGDIAIDSGDGNKFKYYNGSAWIALMSGGSGSFTSVSSISNSAGNITLSPVTTSGAVVIDSGTSSFSTGSGALRVTGGVGITENLNVGGNMQLTGAVDIGNTATIHSQSGTAYTATSSSVNAPPGVGVATANDINSDGTFSGYQASARNTANTYQSGYMGLVSNSTGYTPTMVFGRQTGATAYTESMRIDTNGNVGIGTTAPTQALEVVGTVKTSNLFEAGSATANGTLKLISIGGANSYISNFNSELQVSQNANNGYTTFRTTDSGGGNAERMRITGTGNVGIGITAPAYKIDLSNTDTSTGAGLSAGARLVDVANPSADSSTLFTGIYSKGEIQTGNTRNFTTGVLGSASQGYHRGTGTVAIMAGANAEVYNSSTGTLTEANGVQAAITNKVAGNIGSASGVGATIVNQGTGTITSASAFTSRAPTNTGGGAITNYYGLYIETPTVATNNYGVFSQGGTNYFGGNVGIGTSAPSTNLEVNSTSATPVRVTSTSTSATGVLLANSKVWSVNSAGSAGTLAPDGSFLVRNATDNINALTISPAGNVGIGTTAPARLLHVNGPMRVQPAALPGTPAVGDIAVDSGDSNKLKYYTGSAWIDLGAASSGTISSVTNISNSAGDITLAPQTTTGKVAVTSGTPSTSTTNGALVVTGGAGVSGNLFVGGTINSNTSINGYNFNAISTGTFNPLTSYRSTSGVDEKYWDFFHQANSFSLRAVNDSYLGSTNAIVFNRTGTTITSTLIPSGNVGIGTTAPSSRLHVTGPNSGGYPVTIQAAPGTGPAGFMNIAMNNTTTGAYKSNIDFQNNGNNKFSLGVDYLGNGTNNFGLFDNVAGVHRFFVDPSGNVGIGTTAPSGVLDVNGNSATRVQAILRNTNATSKKSELVWSRPDLGTTLGWYAGTDAAQTGGDNFYIWGGNGGGGGYRIFVDTNGKVGMGTTTPSEVLEVNGSVRATSFISSSDIRLKRDVASAGGLDIVTQLTGVDWIWKSTGQPDSGVIAQDVEKVLPNAVVTDPNTGLKAVKYNALFAPIIQSIKELYYRLMGVEAKVDRAVASLKAENEKLKADNAAKEKEMAELKARMDRIEKMLAPKTKAKTKR